MTKPIIKETFCLYVSLTIAVSSVLFLSASAGLSLRFQVARYIKVVGVN